MKNRIVGVLIIGIAILIGFIIFLFNKALADIVGSTCVHGPSCSMWTTIGFQTNVGIGIMIFIVIIGLYLIFFGKEEKIITKIKTVKQQIEPRKMTKGNYEKIFKTLASDEREVLKKIIESEGTMFQAEIVDKTGFPKVKVTRILDRLEGKGLVERKRRGMTNIVVLKR